VLPWLAGRARDRPSPIVTSRSEGAALCVFGGRKESIFFGGSGRVIRHGTGVQARWLTLAVEPEEIGGPGALKGTTILARVWAGLDVGVETTSICVITDCGQVLQEATCRTDVKCVHSELRWLRRRRFARVGLEGSGGITLARGLRSLGYTVDLYETRQLSKFLRARRNKTDAGDALGIAQAGRIGASMLPKVYLKTLECQSLQSRLVIRRHLVRARAAAVSLLCRQIELYGGRVSSESRSMQLRRRVIAELSKLFGRSARAPAPELRHLLDHCEQLIAYQYAVDLELKRVAAANEVCRRFMEIPGVGPLCALTFFSVVDDPFRFERSADVGSYLGLTPRLHQSGLTMRAPRISRMGNKAARALLVQAAIGFMRWANEDSVLRSWALAVEQRRGRGKSRVALARKLALVMLSMWKTGEAFALDHSAPRLSGPAGPDLGKPQAQ
jgi:transposase